MVKIFYNQVKRYNNMAAKIKNIVAREILDSRGNPTIEVKVELIGKITAIAAVPSGASTGGSEALELRDGDMKSLWRKRRIKAVKNINEIIARL